MTSENFKIKIDLPEENGLSNRDKIIRNMTPKMIWNIQKVKEYLESNIKTENIRNILIAKANKLPHGVLQKFIMSINVHIQEAMQSLQQKEFSIFQPVPLDPNYNKNRENNEINDFIGFLKEKNNE